MNIDNDLSQFVPNVHFEQIRVKDLVSNQDYQRYLSTAHVKRAVANFNLYQINPVKVSRRDGINYVFNGQHTVEIIAMASGSRDTPVWCMIYDDLAYTEEADIFANQQQFTKPLLPYEIFMAHIEAGNDKQLLIKSLVESYNLTITSSRTPGGICAISSLETIHDKYGFEVLDHVLRLIVNTWEGGPMSFSANMLRGVARLLYVYKDQLKDDIFIERCGKASIKEISRTAKERRDGSLGFSETLLNLYNKKTKNPLPYEKLYTHNKVKSLKTQKITNNEEPTERENSNREDDYMRLAN